MSKTTINILVAVVVAGILVYLMEESTILVAVALIGLGYLLFSNNILAIA